MHDWDLAGGEAELKKAIELDPNDATPRQWYAESLFWLGGREEEALAEITRARQLDPRSLIIWRDFGADHIFIRRYDEAIAICKKLAEENPKFSTAYSCIAEAYWRKGMYSQAIKEYRVESQVSGDRDESDYVSAMEKGFRTGGWRGALERGIEVLEEQRKTGYSHKASLIYRRTKNLRAVQLLLGHSKLESTVRYIEVDDALGMAEQTEA